jgi:hypothetical protein
MLQQIEMSRFFLQVFRNAVENETSQKLLLIGAAGFDFIA